MRENLKGRATRARIVATLAAANGAPMTEEEIGTAVGRSRAIVHRHLYRLRAEGRILWDPPKKRTARIAPPATTTEVVA